MCGGSFNHHNSKKKIKHEFWTTPKMHSNLKSHSKTPLPLKK
jgi:hypothetical protein